MDDDSTNPGELASQPRRERSRASENIWSIVVDLLLLYCAQHVLEWGVPCFTSAWEDVLWAINLSLVVSIVGRAVLLAYDALWFRRVVEVITTSLALVASYWMYAVFPLDFGALDGVMRLALLGVTFALAIATIVVTILAVIEISREGCRRVVAAD